MIRGTQTVDTNNALIRFKCITVFVGEVKNGQISGFHNWIRFYLEEKAGNVDYRGYIKPRSRKSTAQTNDDDPVLTLQFKWNEVEKFVGTSFIGKRNVVSCFMEDTILFLILLLFYLHRRGES